MIEGLKIRVPCKELQSHLHERANYHMDRAETKAKELPGIREALEKIKTGLDPKQVTHMNKGSISYSLDPNETIENLESDIRDHRNKALAFDYLGAHLFDDDYNLDEAALRRLEILK